MSSHVCTSEDLSEGSTVLSKGKCLICCNESQQIGGYVGVYCPNCKRSWSPEMWRGGIVRMRCEILGLSRKEMGKLIGVAGSRIKRYELLKCPDCYWNKTKELMIKHWSIK